MNNDREIWYFFTLLEIKTVWNIICCSVRMIITVDLYESFKFNLITVAYLGIYGHLI